jgi:sugar phosphate isomerase/epimerase
MSIGINTNLVPTLNITELFKNIKSAGFDSVMIAFKRGDVEEQIIEAKRVKLKIPYVHLSCRESNCFWVVSPETTKYLSKLRREIDICFKYKIPLAVMHIATGNPNGRPVKPNTVGLNNIKAIVDYALSKNVKIAIENVDKYTLKHVSYIFKNITSEKLGFCYDVGHHNLYYANKDIFKKYKNRLVAIHLHDNQMDFSKLNDYTRDLHLLPFDGKINYQTVCSNLAKVNYDNTIMLEVCRTSTSNPDKYKEIDMRNFLKEAKKRAKKISEIVKTHKR